MERESVCRFTAGCHGRARFSGQNAELVVPDAGSYTFRARLVAANNPTLRITKAELVLKK